jgi:hypothetical protein
MLFSVTQRQTWARNQGPILKGFRDCKNNPKKEKMKLKKNKRK